MSWADDIRCLYCDGRLPLYRKITSGQFCSAAHRKAYWAEQERLAVERLHQTHDSLHAYRPMGPVEAILGKTEPEPAAPPLFAVPSLADERPAWMPLVNTGDLPIATLVTMEGPRCPRWLEDCVAAIGLEPLDCTNPLRRPTHTLCSFDCGFDLAGQTGLNLAWLERPAELPSAEPAPLPLATKPVTSLKFEAAPETHELDPQVPDPAPLCETMCALDHPAAAVSAICAHASDPVLSPMRVQLPLDSVRLQHALAPAALVEAGLRKLPVDRVNAAPAASGDSLRAFDFETGVPQLALSTPPLRPRLQIAAGRRYPVESRGSMPAVAVAETSGLPASPAAVALPQRDAAVLRAAASASSLDHEPARAGLVPIACAPAATDSASSIRPAPAALSLPQPPRTEPMRPGSRLEPIDSKPIGDFISAPPEASSFEFQPEPHSDHLKVWAHAIDFWNRAPRDLKVLAFAIPVLLGLALHPALPKVRVAAPAAASGFQKNFKNAVYHRWGAVRQSMLDRAAIALDEDFRSGLDEWVSRGDATTDWSFDATGFVRPGPLAMYRPSMGLSDYQMQFLGMIDKKALSWVARAQDFENYYVVKMVVLKDGPLPTIGITRYAVINGKADSRADTVVPVDARQDMLYRVRLDVHGDDFALWVQGQIVDSWTEPRLTHGGVGFFAAPGEESRLRWVQVTHQYDMLGRLCAYLAPYNVASANAN